MYCNHTGTWHDIQIKYLEILSVDKLLDVYNLTMKSTTISSTIWRTGTIRIFIIFQFDDSKVRLLVCGSSTMYDVRDEKSGEHREHAPGKPRVFPGNTRDKDPSKRDLYQAIIPF